LCSTLVKSKSVRQILDKSSVSASTRNVWSIDAEPNSQISSLRSIGSSAGEEIPTASAARMSETTANPLTAHMLAAHNATATTAAEGKPRSGTTQTAGSNQFANPVSGNFKFDRIKQPLFVSFNHLNLFLKKNDAKVLADVFGVIRPFHLTALMGPSGAGKTTLLALLRGQAHYARITGTMRVNGNSVSSLVPFREQMAFVPQDDILYEQLTVEDNILFSAILFNKRGYRKPSELLPMVYYAEEVLGIAFIRNSIVGSP
jgi:ABC-type multidrug transport system fused ATPase/permease subunit